MVSIVLPDALAHQLEEIAQRENRPLTDVVASMIEQYEPKSMPQEESDAAFDAIFGIYDDDVTDMSATLRETLQAYFQKNMPTLIDTNFLLALVYTFDHRDFRIFRPKHCPYLELLP